MVSPAPGEPTCQGLFSFSPLDTRAMPQKTHLNHASQSHFYPQIPLKTLENRVLNRIRGYKWAQVGSGGVRFLRHGSGVQWG